MRTYHEVITCSFKCFFFFKTNLNSVLREIIQLYKTRLIKLMPKLLSYPNRCLLAPVTPVYPSCGMHIRGLVRHGCVERGLVSTQDRHKYNTCHSLFCPGNRNHHTNLDSASVCIRFVFGLYSVCISRTKRRLACSIYL